MDKRVKTATIATVVFLSLLAIVYAVAIGTIEFPFDIASAPEMTETPILMGPISVVVGDSGSIADADTGVDLVLYAPTTIELTMTGYSAFNTFACTIKLYDGPITWICEATIDQSSTQPVVLSVSGSDIPAGTYDIWVGCQYTAGGTTTSGTVILTLGY